MNETEAKLEKEVTISKISIDMHLKQYRVVRQHEHGPVQPAQRFEPKKFYEWLKKEQRRAKRVVVCYEAGCFGYEPARRMEALGVEVYVIAPQNWDEAGKRQVNDKWDAAVMCRRLSDYLDGHRKALRMVHIPSREEERKRAAGRFRDTLCKEKRRVGAIGRSLLLQREMAVRGRWWRGRTWQKINQTMAPWVIEQLQSCKELIEQLEKQIALKEKALCASAAGERILFGEGQLTHTLLKRELLNPQRFGNARQVGNYFGLCPSERSSGEKRRLGPITKHGNRRLRKMMIELAWRVVHWQPQYCALRPFAAVLASRNNPGARKKAIVGVARRLAVDLWRIQLGRKSAQELGLRLA